MRRNLTGAVPDISIGDAARRCGLTQRAIRFYQERGLLELRRNARGNRVFDGRTVRRLDFIVMARRTGLTIHKILQLLTVGDSDGEVARDAALLAACRQRLALIDHDRDVIGSTIEALSAPSTDAPAMRRSTASGHVLMVQG